MKLSRALLLAIPLTMLPAVSHAQVAYNYLNYYCLWDPGAGTYSINVHRYPGQTLVHTITDQGITGSVCTADATDLMSWIQHDLQGNGTWDLLNDQVETRDDVFCPDGVNVNLPTTIGTMYGTVYAPTYSGSNFQASVNVNYACPDTPQGPIGPGGSPPVTATYAPSMCARARVIGAVAPGEDESVQQLNLGQAAPGVDDWRTNFLDQSGPYAWPSTPGGTPHCDPLLAGLADTYLQSNAAALASTMTSEHQLKCNPGEAMRFYVDSCEERGDDSAYGYQVACCPQRITTHGTTTGANCHSLCVPTSVSQVTHFYGPTTPVYTDPATVCQDLIADTTAWMDSSGPGGPTQPWICGPNWGVAQGGYYVPHTLSMSCNVVNQADPTCSGDARVDVCLRYNCER